jgi:hypothetical protein
VAIGLVLAAPAGHGLQPRVLLGALVLVAYALVRTYRPIDLHQGSLRLASLAEAALHLAVVAATGYWESPFVVSLLSAVIVVGFARGFSAALRIAAASALALALPYHLTTTSGWDEALALTMQWTSELLLVAAVAGYARRFSVEAAERHDRDVDRLDRLAEANTLLHSLHDVAQSLPTSLDLDEALDSVVTRVRTLCDARSLVIVLTDGAGSGWTVARQLGTRLPSALTGLPPALDEVLHDLRAWPSRSTTSFAIGPTTSSDPPRPARRTGGHADHARRRGHHGPGHPGRGRRLPGQGLHLG